MPTIKAVCIQNPFDPFGSQVARDLPAGHDAKWYADQFTQPTGLEVIVAVNGEVVANPELVFPCGGDSVSVCAVPHGGGNGKDTWRMVAMVALMVVAPYVGAYGMTAGATAIGGGSVAFGMVSTAGFAIGTAAVMIAGGALINSVFPAKVSGLAERSAIEQSRTYGWNAAPNAMEPGAALPELFGTRRIYPPMLARYISTEGDEQYLNMLFAVAGHKVDAITDIEINGQPLSVYTDVADPIIRLGTVNQSVIKPFAKLRNDEPVAVELTTDWTTRQVGNVDGFGVAFSAPQGLWQVASNGKLLKHSVFLEAEYRKVGDASWKPWFGGAGGAKPAEVYFATETALYVYGWDAKSLIEPGMTIHSFAGGSPYGVHIVNKVTKKSNQHTFGPGEEDFEYVQCTEIKASGDAFHASIDDYLYLRNSEFTGDTTKTKRWYYEINEPYGGPGEYEYRMRHTVAPMDDAKYGNMIVIDYHQQIIDDAFNYPQTALLAVTALATDELSGAAPRVSCLATRATVPVWTGSAYVSKPATNPAWVNWHQLHNATSGGGVPAARIILTDFQSFADWCDQKGYTCNIYFDQMSNLKTALDMVSMLGRGQVVQVGSKFTVQVDKPDTATQRYMFGMGNISADSFGEEWLPMEDRANAIEVTYWDANSDRQTITLFAHDYDQHAGPTNKQSIPLYGCNGHEQAAKYGRFLLNKQRYLTLTASWTADVDAIACLPNDVVDVTHDVPEWGESGRLVAVDGNTITLDKIVRVVNGQQYALEIKHNDDTREVKTFTGAADTDTLTFTWGKQPSKYDLYSFGPVSQRHKSFRVVEITRDSDLRRRLVCLEYVAEVYDDDADIPAPVAPVVGQITGFRAAERWLIGDDGKGRSVIDLTWRGAGMAFEIYIKPGTKWIYLASTTQTAITIDSYDFVVGRTYGFQVRRDGTQIKAETVKTIEGKTWPPSDVSGVFAEATLTGIRITWNTVPDKDVFNYELRVGDDFATGTTLFAGASNTFLWRIVAANLYKFWVVAKDTTGKASANPAYYQLFIENPQIPDVSHAFVGENIILSWQPVAGTFAIEEYIIKTGAVYDTATEIGRTKATAFSFKALWSGGKRFWVEAVDAAGNESTPSAEDATINPPSAIAQINPQVVHNVVLLRWAEPAVHTLPIAYYRFRVGSDFGTATELGTLDATFAVQQQVAAGTYLYWLQPVDTAGNEGPEASVQVHVSAPPNYVLLDDQLLDLTTPGSATNTSHLGGELLMPVNVTETWEEHFVNNSFGSPDDQLAAGYPYYLQPTPASATWEQQIDYGVLIPAAAVSVEVQAKVIAGTPLYSVDISVSANGTNWTTHIDIERVFEAEFRYVKYKITVTGAADALLRIESIRAKLDMVRIQDSGKIDALSTDANGTWVDFNLPFLDITAITPNVFALSGDGPVYPVIIFNDVPSPTGFYIKVFNNAGTRLSRTVGWVAEGV
jgi:predicted phage tail protein